MPSNTVRALLPTLTAAFLSGPAAVADFDYSDSAAFPVDLLTLPPTEVADWADSASFPLDLRRMNRRWADSGAFIFSDAPPPAPTPIAVETPLVVVPGEPFDVRVILRNNGGPGDHGGISISFPDLTDTDGGMPPYTSPIADVEVHAETTFATVGFYDAGDTIDVGGTNGLAQHLLVEGDEDGWDYDEAHTLTLTITPNQAGTLTIRIRGWIAEFGTGYGPPTYRCPDQGGSGRELDQQQYWSEVVTLNVGQPIEGYVLFDHDNDAGTELIPVKGAKVLLVQYGDFPLGPEDKDTDTNGWFSFGTTYSNEPELSVRVYAANDRIQVKPFTYHGRLYFLNALTNPYATPRDWDAGSGGETFTVEIKDWDQSGAFALYQYVNELDQKLQEKTEDVLGGEWNAVRGENVVTICWTDFVNADGPKYKDRGHMILLNSIHAYVYDPDPGTSQPQRAAIAHEYGHYVHDLLGDGLYRGHGKTYSEGVAEMFRTLFTFWFDPGQPIIDEDPNEQYEPGHEAGLGVKEIFWDMLDDVTTEADTNGGFDGIAFEFGYIWYALLQGPTSTIKHFQGIDFGNDFWNRWQECEYDDVDSHGVSWNDHVRLIYQLHGLPMDIWLIELGRGVYTFEELTLVTQPGSIPEDTVVSAGTLPTTDLMVTNGYTLTPHTETGELIFSSPADLTIGYDDTGLSQAEEDSLAIYVFNPTIGAWADLASVVDTVANTVSTQIVELGDFAVGLPELDLAPDSPTGLQIVDEVATASRVTLSWDANTNGDLAGYLLEIPSNGAREEQTHVLADDEVSHEIPAIEPGSYTFMLYTFDEDGNHSDAATTGLDVVDTDEDGLPDVWELQWLGFLVYDACDDPDSDGADDLAEYQFGADPMDSDSDDDNIPDGWEIGYGLDPLDPADAAEDPDGDCFTNLAEYEGGGTNPRDGDSHPIDCNENCVWDDQDAIGGGDFDADGDVDLDDHSAFRDCLAGPGATPNPASLECIGACRAAFDFAPGDGDVDLADFGEFQEAFTGG